VGDLVPAGAALDGEVIPAPGHRDPGGRNEQIREAFLAGDSIEEIGQRWQLSNDRVQDILREQHRAIRALTAAQQADDTPASRMRGLSWQERVAIVRENTPTWRDRVVAAANAPNPDEQLDPRVQALIEQSLAPETRRKYRWAGELYVDFCDLNDHTEWPGTAQTLAGFGHWLAERPVTRGKNKGVVGMAPNSIRLAVSAVRSLHEVLGWNPPSTKLARKAIKGHENKRANDQTHKFTDGVGAPPVKLPLLRDLVGTCDLSTARGLRDRAILCAGLAMMARRHVLAGLDLDDLYDHEAGVEVFVRKDKTVPDPSQPSVRSRRVKLPWWPAQPDLCPVTALKAWQRYLTDYGITDGPLFRAIDRHGHLNGTPDWAGRRGLSTRMDPVIVEMVVQRCAIAAQIKDPTNYTAHSLRSGGATTAYEAGADILAIARHGGWGDRSPVVFRYIRDVDDWLRNPMLLVGAGAKRSAE
jgi:integrase